MEKLIFFPLLKINIYISHFQTIKQKCKKIFLIFEIQKKRRKCLQHSKLLGYHNKNRMTDKEDTAVSNKKDNQVNNETTNQKKKEDKSIKKGEINESDSDEDIVSETDFIKTGGIYLSSSGTIHKGKMVQRAKICDFDSNSQLVSSNPRFIPSNRNNFKYSRLLRTIKATANFKTNHEEELPVKIDDIITIHSEPSYGWCQGSIEGKTGWFPVIVSEELTKEAQKEYDVSSIQFILKKKTNNCIFLYYKLEI